MTSSPQREVQESKPFLKSTGVGREQRKDSRAKGNSARNTNPNCISQGKVGGRNLCAITEQIIKAGWSKCHAPGAPCAEGCGAELQLLIQLLIQECREHIPSWQPVPGHVPWQDGDLPCGTHRVLVLSSAAPLLLPPAPASGGFSAPPLSVSHQTFSK